MDERRFPTIPNQYGFATTSQLTDAGFSEWNLHELALNGQRVTRAVYASTVGPWSDDLLTVAGGLWAGKASALTGLAALHLLNVEELPKPAVKRFLVPPEARTRRNGLAMVTVRTRRRPSTGRAGGVAVVNLERALADAGRHKELPEDALMAATLAALHKRRTTAERLAREVALGGDAGTGGVQQAILAHQLGAWSRPEAVLGDGVRGDVRFPRMLANPRLTTRDGRLIGVPDGYFPGEGVVVQVHSQRHHFGEDAAGVDRWAQTLAKDLGYQVHGIVVVPVTPRTIYTGLAAFLDDLATIVTARRGMGPRQVVIS